MTVAELKKILNDIPEDSTVIVEYWNPALQCLEKTPVEHARDESAYLGIRRTFSRVLNLRANKESF